MSDEIRKDEENEVEVHRRDAANDEPAAEGEVDDGEVEAHMRRASARMDSPRHI
ncbi:MAG TPA: hypothetical protein VKO84_05050 [Gaiellaceae bacterium]|nr:hypothetical protein [Gaiellaceae bacterium]